MTTDERDVLRDLLIKYESALYLAEDLALSLLEVLQPGEVEISMERARERRRFVGDALASVEAGEEYANKVWAEFGIERRKSSPSPAYKGKERRRARRRTQRTTK